jgi:hypothetical protein
MSKIKIMVQDGVPLATVEYGSAVRTPKGGDTVYLVVSPMDGSGLRKLVSIASGTFKEYASQELLVQVLDATLIVKGQESTL